jgi:copper chaperone NosL
MKKVLIIALTALAACRTGPPRPIDIEPSDMCSRCRMAISQNRYAAELVDPDGNVWKFDDIGCMVRYTRDHSLNPRLQTYFVMDYQSQHWLDAGRAIYVRSGEIPSPMAGGIVAFENQANAEEFSRGVHGELLRFEGLWMSK